MVNSTGYGTGQATLTLNVIVSQVLAPGRRIATSCSRVCGMAPHGVQCQVPGVSPPSGSTALADRRVSGTVDWLVPCTPTTRCRPLCTEHSPMAWVSGAVSVNGNDAAGAAADADADAVAEVASVRAAPPRA